MHIKNEGFTLLEILLVIATIGILAAIVLLAINPNRQINQARQVSINSEKNTIEKALQQDLIDTGNYPTSVDGLQRKICSNTVTTDCINITGDLVPNYIAEIPSNTTYIVNTSNDRNRIYVNTNDTALNFRCPTGYIRVPGNSMYGTKDFCVMKYEAKAVDINNPTVGLLTPNTGSNTIADNTTPTTSANGRAVASVASGYPIANINQTTASSYCISAGANLITNAEWMTIARNIEAQLNNWTTGTAASSIIGVGGLYRGHSDNNPTTALEAGLDNNGYIGTGQSGFSIEKRTHILSNGEIIWDMSGNVFEWINNNIIGLNKPNSSSGGFWQDWTSINNYGNLNYDFVRPSNASWNSANNMGRYLAGTVTGTSNFAYFRGGNWNHVVDSGIYNLNLGYNNISTDIAIGFRCVIR
jgi:prepilin-type N-terminal cleavage/methylation domain-containing protein